MDLLDKLFVSDISRIDQNLYLSSCEAANDLNTVNSLGIQRIVTLDSMGLDHSQQHLDYLFIKAADNPNEDLLSRFEECYQFISEGVLRGHKVLVHCVAGVSRSATIVISYVMKKNDISMEEAMALVRKKRSIIDPNKGFERQLRLFDKMGRKVDAMNGEYRQFLVEHLRYKIMTLRPWICQMDRSDSCENSSVCQPISNYFRKLRDFMPQNNSIQRQEDVYKCRKCRLYLFNEINVIKTSDKLTTNSNPNCHSVYVEPLNWMLPYIGQQESGAINCSNCYSKLGHFNWSLINCDCIQHKDFKCLVFKIDAKKVDSSLNELFAN